MHVKRHLLIVGLVLALLATSCASGSESSSDVATASDTSEAAESDSDEVGSAEGSATDESASDDGDATSTGSGVENGEASMAASSPLGAFFAEDGGFESALDEYRRQVEEGILTCMAAEGFEFAVSETGSNDNPVQASQNDLTIREWTLEFGFGISTSFDSVAQNQASNPNVEIFFSMGESERESWALTLNGVGSAALAGGGGDGLNNRPLEEQGCIGQAIIDTGGAEALEGLDTFGDAFDEAQEALFDRREMVEVVDAWTRCMADAGYLDYAVLDDPETEIIDRFNLVLAPMRAALDGLSDAEGQALISGDELDVANLPNLDVTALRELQDDELPLALADLDCYEAEVQATYEPLRDDLENGLLTEYATEFDALRNIGN